MSKTWPAAAPKIRSAWQWNESQLRAWQLERLNEDLRKILPSNRFYREKLGVAELQLESIERLGELPLTTKDELVQSAADSPNGISLHHTFPPESYSRLHRTSGTTGNPLVILDTDHDWENWSWTWQHVLEAAQVQSTDRIFLAFSFGPFIGFWSAHQACVDRGALVIPGGGLSSLARLEFMRQCQANIMCCTPSYALHLAEVAATENVSLKDIGIEKIIVAGEAGGSVPSVRERMMELWQAQIVDHSGATEVGPWGFGWPDRPGLHIIETSFIAELIPLQQSSPDPSAGHDEFFELVLTSLGRIGAPVMRYRTGDVVSVYRPEEGPCRFLWLPQGVVGRADNMVTIRGVNIFPSSIDAVVREVDAITEYRVTVTRESALDQLQLEIEAGEDVQQQLEKKLMVRLGLRVPVEVVPPNSLPRSELKSRRWQDKRNR